MNLSLEDTQKKLDKALNRNQEAQQPPVSVEKKVQVISEEIKE